MPNTGEDLIRDNHDCLNLRYPGAVEFQWQLQAPEGVKRFAVKGRCECDDGDILTEWAVAGHGIVLKPVFEIAEHLKSGRLVPVAQDTPPTSVQMACLYTHRRHQDPKTRLFMDFMTERMANVVRAAEAEFG